MKKRNIIYVLTALLMCLFVALAGCGKGNVDGDVDIGGGNTDIAGGNTDIAGGNTDDDNSITESADVLVAYFSCTETTKDVAEAIHAQVSDSDIYRIVPAVPYTSADLNYSNGSCRANTEQNDPTARPEISGKLKNVEKYGVIFLGYPIWWGQAPKIIYTFLESFDIDFDGVTIIPFCTSGSSGECDKSARVRAQGKLEGGRTHKRQQRRHVDSANGLKQQARARRILYENQTNGGARLAR